MDSIDSFLYNTSIILSDISTTILILILFLGFIILKIFNYIKTVIADYKIWNGGISPYTNEPWFFIGRDFHNIKHYEDKLNNAISIRTCIDLFYKK